MEKMLKLGKFILVTATIYFIVYNTYFGWNKLPINDLEKACDKVCSFAFIIGWAIYLLPILDKYEKWIKTK